MKILFKAKSLKTFFLLGFLATTVGLSAQFTYTDTLCVGSQNVVYGITNPTATSTYTWWLKNGNGVIDNSITSNDSIIQIDWGVNAGTDTLYALETTIDGCIGDTVVLGIILNELPTVTVVADSICPGFSANLTFEFTGTAPWIVEYTDGTNNFADTTISSPYIASLPSYSSAQTIDVTSLADANCTADPSTLPTGISIYVYPTSTTGPIFHY